MKLLNGHLQAAVAHAEAHRALRRTEGGTDGGGQAEAHSTASAAGHHAARLAVLEVAAPEHLVLPHIGDQHGTMLAGFADGPHHLAHQEWSLGGMDGGLYHARAFLIFIWLEACYPFVVACLVDEFRHAAQRLLAVAHHGQCGAHVLVYLARVDIEVYDVCLGGIGFQIARYAVVESHAHGDEHVTLVRHHVGRQVAVHAQHAHVQRMVAGQGA